MSAPIEMLLSRLDGVRQIKANGWMTRCPAHNGDGRSLAVTLLDNGMIMLHCFAYQCDVSDIVAAIGMTLSDLFPDRLPEHRYEPRKHGVSSIDVLRAMKHELLVVDFLAQDFTSGELTPELYDRARISAARIRKALDLCDG